MFYNIKIKSGSAEFILESNNKQITQREMDIYFSRIFDASEEFKAQIKDVEVKSENVISIDYLEKQSDLSTQEEKKIIIEEPIVAKTYKNIEEIKQAQETLNQDSSSLNSQEENAEFEENKPVGEQNLPEEDFNLPTDESQNRIEQIKNAPLTSILIQNEPLPDNDLVFTRQKLLYEEMQKEKEKVRIITEEENQRRLNDIFSSDISDYDDDIETAVAQAKEDIAKIDDVNTNSETDKNAQDINQPIEFLGNNIEQENIDVAENHTDENIQVVQDAEVAQDIKVAQDAQNIDIVEEVQTAQEVQDIEDVEVAQKVEVEENSDNPSIDNFEAENTSDREIQNEKIEPQKEEKIDVENVDIIDLSTFEQADSALNSTVSQVQEIISIRPEKKENETMDFKTYLEGFDTNSLVDDFLICAYYIKNILGQDGFTMKEINSKIFQATGKIADMTVVQALSNKEYISFVQNEFSNKYFITPDGENYFRVNFEE